MATESKVFIDTAPFIYYIEKDNLEYFEKVKKFFAISYATNRQLVTSAITEEEYFVLPFRTGNSILIEKFKNLAKTLNINIQVIDEEIDELVSASFAKTNNPMANSDSELAIGFFLRCFVLIMNHIFLHIFPNKNNVCCRR